MPRKTQLWQLLPWIGGLNTSLDPAMIPESQLTNAENVVTGVNNSKQKREGINKNWDDVAAGSTDAIIGAADYWYYSGGSMLQKRVSLNEAGTMRWYNSSGAATSITVGGVAYSSPTIASCKVMNSLFIVACDGTSNRVKKWSGSGNAADLRATWAHTTISRASSGTTRTIVLGQSFKGVSGDYVVITGLTESAGTYNGTWAVTGVSTTTVSNDTIQYTSTGSFTETTTGDTGGTVHGLAPNGALLQTHQGRLLTTDKTRPYRVHYSAPFDPETWGGYGDSGVIDIDVGDDDPQGITAIFPTFQGDLYVAKRTKLYRIRGLIPDYSIEKLSDSLGVIGPEAYTAVGQSDIIWVSEKGVHSLVTTDKYGDVEEAFLSKDIQKSFNGEGDFPWSTSRRKYTKVRYSPSENLVFFGVTESSLNSLGGQNNSLWVFDTVTKQWISRWPSISCETLFVVRDSDKPRLYLGSYTSRLYKTFTGSSTDTTEAGASQNITLKVKTGLIYVDKNPYVLKGFKKLILYYTPRGTQVISATARVDKLSRQAVSFDQSAGGATLGGTFTLGQSVLGSEGLFAPYTRTIDGYGRSIQIELQEGSQNADYTLEGLGVEYQSSEVRHEVNQGA